MAVQTTRLEACTDSGSLTPSPPRAELRLVRKQLKLALADLRTSLQIKLECCGEGHIECAYTFVALARLHRQLGHVQPMVSCSQEAYHIRMRTLGREHPRTRRLCATRAPARRRLSNTDSLGIFFPVF